MSASKLRVPHPLVPFRAIVALPVGMADAAGVIFLVFPWMRFALPLDGALVALGGVAIAIGIAIGPA